MSSRIIQPAKQIMDTSTHLEYFTDKRVRLAVPAKDPIDPREGAANDAVYLRNKQVNAPILSNVLDTDVDAARSVLGDSDRGRKQPSRKVTWALAYLVHNPALAHIVSGLDDSMEPLPYNQKARRMHVATLEWCSAVLDLDGPEERAHAPEFGERVWGGGDKSDADVELLKTAMSGLKTRSLAPEQIETISDRLDMPKSALAECIGVSRQAFYRYTGGEYPAPGPVVFMLASIALDPVMAVYASGGDRVPERAFDRSRGAWARMEFS
jgi:hypothetical protein